jgi:hypothetical protein
MPPLKGGQNGPNEVIHAEDTRGLEAEGKRVKLSGDRPGVSHRQGNGAGVSGTGGGSGLDLAVAGAPQATARHTTTRKGTDFFIVPFQNIFTGLIHTPDMELKSRRPGIILSAVP